MRQLRIIVAAASMLAAADALAQRAGGSIDAGALNMRYADSIHANAVALTPAFWSEYRSASFSTSGTLSRFTEGGWSAQGIADASVFTRRMRLLFGEIEGTAGGSTHDDGARTGQILGSARAHLAAANRGIWIGGGLGSTWDGLLWRSVRQGEAAAWTRIDAASAFASVTPVVVDDSIRYTDSQVAASLGLRRIELGVSAGFRTGSRLPTLGGTAKSWGSASFTGWLARRVAVVASAGTYPVDLTQGFPGGRFVSLGVRVGSRRFPPARSSVAELEDMPGRLNEGASIPGISRFEMRSAGGTMREIRITAPGASTVEVMGDFTGWQPVLLRASGNGLWTVALPVEPGIHELNVRVDGASWGAPPGLPVKRDEFGGSVGILVIR